MQDMTVSKPGMELQRRQHLGIGASGKPTAAPLVPENCGVHFGIARNTWHPVINDGKLICLCSSLAYTCALEFASDNTSAHENISAPLFARFLARRCISKPAGSIARRCNRRSSISWKAARRRFASAGGNTKYGSHRAYRDHCQGRGQQASDSFC